MEFSSLFLLENPICVMCSLDFHGIVFKERVKATIGSLMMSPYGLVTIEVGLSGHLSLHFTDEKSEAQKAKKKRFLQAYGKQSGQSEPRFPQNTPRVLLVLLGNPVCGVIPEFFLTIQANHMVSLFRRSLPFLWSLLIE